MKHEPISFDNARIFGIDSNYPFLRLQDGTFIELTFGVRFETDFPKDFELALQCAEFIQDHFEAIRKGLTKFKVDQTSELRIIAPEIGNASLDCGEVSYFYNGIFFERMSDIRVNSKKGYDTFVSKHLIDWIEQNHDLQYSEICCNGIEIFIRKNDITINVVANFDSKYLQKVAAKNGKLSLTISGKTREYNVDLAENTANWLNNIITNTRSND